MRDTIIFIVITCLMAATPMVAMAIGKTPCTGSMCCCRNGVAVHDEMAGMGAASCSCVTVPVNSCNIEPNSPLADQAIRLSTDRGKSLPPPLASTTIDVDAAKSLQSASTVTVRVERPPTTTVHAYLLACVLII